MLVQQHFHSLFSFLVLLRFLRSGSSFRNGFVSFCSPLIYVTSIWVSLDQKKKPESSILSTEYQPRSSQEDLERQCKTRTLPGSFLKERTNKQSSTVSCCFASPYNTGLQQIRMIYQIIQVSAGGPQISKSTDGGTYHSCWQFREHFGMGRRSPLAGRVGLKMIWVNEV